MSTTTKATAAVGATAAAAAATVAATVPAPSVGRVVHFFDMVDGFPTPVAAIITAVSGDPKDNRVTLAVFSPSLVAQPVTRELQVSYGPKIGQWSWPKLV